MLLALDIDGVLYPLHEIVRDWLVENNFIEEGTSVKEAFRFVRNQSKEFVDYLFSLPLLYERRLPSDSIIEEVWKISKNSEIIYLTQRNPSLRRVTLQFLKYFPAPEAVFFVENKQQFCLENDVDVIFDDRLMNLVNHKNTLPVCVQSFNHPEVVEPRFKNLSAAFEFACKSLGGCANV